MIVVNSFLQHGGSDIKWVDGGKPLFKVSTFVVSTVNTQVSTMSYNRGLDYGVKSDGDSCIIGGNASFHELSNGQVAELGKQENESVFIE